MKSLLANLGLPHSGSRCPFLIFFLSIALIFIACSDSTTSAENESESPDSFTDTRDDRVYKTVTIGDQTWMAENLYHEILFYTWEEAKTVCPSGWHLPSDDEWKTLINEVGGEKTAGLKLKSNSGWENNGKDSYDFAMQPAGYRDSLAKRQKKGSSALFWSSTEQDRQNAYNWRFEGKSDSAFHEKNPKNIRLAVRCVKGGEIKKSSSSSAPKTSSSSVKSSSSSVKSSSSSSQTKSSSSSAKSSSSSAQKQSSSSVQTSSSSSVTTSSSSVTTSSSSTATSSSSLASSSSAGSSSSANSGSSSSQLQSSSSAQSSSSVQMSSSSDLTLSSSSALSSSSMSSSSSEISSSSQIQSSSSEQKSSSSEQSSSSSEPKSSSSEKSSSSSEPESSSSEQISSSSELESSSSMSSSSSENSSSSYEPQPTVYDPITNTLTDGRDGKEYKTVTIDNKTWMAENLNYDYNVATAKSVCYENDDANCEKYGRLYNWSALMDSAGIFSKDAYKCGREKTCTTTNVIHGVCPEGWHIPSTLEWNNLFYATKNRDLNNLKAKQGWSGYEGTDEFGFSILPGGHFFDSNRSYDEGSSAYFWTSNKEGRSTKYIHLYKEKYYHVTSDVFDDMNSVRCIMDYESEDPVIPAPDHTIIFGTLEDTRDGNVYKTVEIGDQIWMAENLRFEYGEDDALSICPENKASNCQSFGRLYTWSAAMDSIATYSNDGKGCGNGSKCEATDIVIGICPENWRLPNKDDFQKLNETVGGESIAGRHLKGVSGNSTYDTGYDLYGFNALPTPGETYVPYWSSSYYSESAYYYSINITRIYSNLSLTPLSSTTIKYNAVRCIMIDETESPI